MLLYPKSNKQDSKSGSFWYRPNFKLSNDDKEIYQKLNNNCKLGFISVVQDKKLRKEEDMASVIFNMILPKCLEIQLYRQLKVVTII